MKKKESAKGQEFFWKKAIVFGVVFVLAIPLLIFIINNLKNRMEALEGQEIVNNFNAPDLSSTSTQIAADMFIELEQALLEFENQMATTTITTTSSTSSDL